MPDFTCGQDCLYYDFDKKRCDHPLRDEVEGCPLSRAESTLLRTLGLGGK